MNDKIEDLIKKHSLSCHLRLGHFALHWYRGEWFVCGIGLPLVKSIYKGVSLADAISMLEGQLPIHTPKEN